MIWLKTLAFLIAAPGTVAVLVPWLLSRWTSMDLGSWRYAGLVFALPGIAGAMWCFRDFVVKGHGTPNPKHPPEKLVVSGLYRISRNPMYVAMILILVGEALWFQKPILFGWAAVMFVVFSLFIRFYEEPKLHALFGEQYERYRQSVRRWL